MTVALQPSLLDADEAPTLGPLGPAVERTPLALGAWVDLRRGWLSGADTLFERLVRAVPWRAERRQMYERVVDVPRLLRFYGEEETLPHPMLTGARQALNEYYAPALGEPFTTAGMCLYRDGRDSVAWHGDLLVMGGSCQRTWEHAVPKTARPVGPRISVQFRVRGVR